MRHINPWTRRRFLALGGAMAANSAIALHPLAQTAQKSAPPREAAGMPPPGVITGQISPLLNGSTARPLRYSPQGGDFVIRNGREFFNRPVYGANSAFRVDAGDLPEFSLYLPGHGGNLKLGLLAAVGSKWAAQADEVLARYRPGRMIYEIRDSLLGNGTIFVELLTTAAGSGLLLKVTATQVSPPVALAWAFAGASGRKGRRNGDIGCELEPVSRFFQVRPEECGGNTYTIADSEAAGAARPVSRLHSPAGDFLLTFPEGSKLAVAEFDSWNSAPSLPDFRNAPRGVPQHPILTGSTGVGGSPLYLSIQQIKKGDKLADPDPGGDPATAFDRRSRQVAAIAGTLRVETPDPYLDAAFPALSIAAEAIWDPSQGCVMHGGVAWRIGLTGWRGPYVYDSIGEHDRTRENLRHWLKKQNLSPVTTADPATGPFDPGVHSARKEGLLHSNGDLAANHYDMNMVFFDVLLRHLRWTGDLAFAEEIWPAFQRHLAWEHRLFRRAFTASSGRQLPLYEAYAAIWASDNLQYSGGGAAHSSAYNIFAFRSAALLARLLHQDPAPYETEANLILEAMQQLLWLPGQGAFAESKDLLGPRTVYNNPALWTLYHTVDSEVADARQAWQMLAERLHTLRRIPVHGEGVPEGDWFMLSCSDWLPYQWSLNLLALAENTHMALAMWQAGMADEAFLLLKGNLLDSMYMGLAPGNFHMTSALDVHRQEAQRDSGDPIGITSRALLEGLFGVQPDMIRGVITIRPGFPSDWNHASLSHRDFDLNWHRDGLTETFEFNSRFPARVPFTLKLSARTTTLPVATNFDRSVTCSFDPAAVGSPVLLVSLPAAAGYKVSLRWTGRAPLAAPAFRTYRIGEALDLPPGLSLAQIDDPQHALAAGRVASPGVHTVFVNVHQDQCRWSMPISFEAMPPAQAFLPVPRAAQSAQLRPLDLAPFLAHRITEIFTRSYTDPRSPFCSLAIPDTLLGGWANIGEPIRIDDTGLRKAGGMLMTDIGVSFLTPPGSSPNCVFLSCFEPDKTSLSVPLTGSADGIYLLMTGTTLPQCSRMDHAIITVAYADGTSARLPLRNPETWWPIEQDYLLDDYLFLDHAPLPPRIDLATGRTRILDPVAFKGSGGDVAGGAATILHLPLDPARTLASLKVEVELYGIVVALLATTLTSAKSDI
jgi:hypothetical protein